ncbi:MAG: ATP-binding cassette domain-containing protein [Myxococcota bacterium]|nr:ATP-binding cassette domain-containing protein [Myxococcota bacterium]
MIELRDVHKSFGPNTILNGVSITMPARQTTAIIGPSGTGKSVLLKHIVGLLRPDSGQVMCLGTDMATANEQQMYAVRRRCGMLFQDGALFDSLSVGENVSFPLVHHATDMSEAQRRERAEGLLEQVGLPGTYQRTVASLSGGQRKRVGLARAMVLKPEILLFDEPNSGLDPMTSNAIDELILAMKESLGITFVIISHDIVGTLKVADRIVMLYGGNVVADAPTTELI